jgi:trk system potassium uptake protein TrkH
VNKDGGKIQTSAKASSHTSLARQVRIRTIGAILSRNGLAGCILFGVPLMIALAEREWAFALGLAVGLIISAVAFLARRRFPIADDVTRAEALASTSISFLLAPMLLAVPFTTLGLSFTDAYFEAMSGITTTGLSVFADVETLPQTVLFTRAWSQWCGGAFFLIAALALVVAPGRIARRLGATQLDDGRSDGLLASTRSRARGVLIVYGAMTVACFAAILAASGDVTSAIYHALAAVSTGGFSSNNNSLAPLPPPATAAALVFCFAAAISLTSYIHLRSGDVRKLVFAREVVSLAILVGVVTCVIAIAERSAEVPDHETLGHALATVVSAQSTAGFSTTPVSDLTPVSKATLVATMMIGGDVGSTAGGIKIARLILITALIQTVILRLLSPPRAVTPIKLGGRVIADDEMSAVFALLALYFLIQTLACLIFVAHGFDLLDALFEVTSALSTVGLSSGITSPDLSANLKWLLAALMWFGRVEVIGALLILLPRTWLK